jgi:putative addiction module component (TIGR02574 family)
MKIDQLESFLLQLPEHDRARLAERLIESLGEEGDIEEAWYDEAERRLAELESGHAKAVPAEEVFASLRAILKE